MKMNYKFLAPLIVVLGLLVWLINFTLVRFLFNSGAQIYDVQAHIIHTLAVVLAALLIFGIAVYRLLATRRRLESELREREEWYRCLFEQAPMGIGTATLDGKVLEANKVMTDITGYSLEELRNINVADIYENPEERQRLLEKVNREGRVADYSVRLKRKDGTPYNALLNMARVNINGQSAFQTIQLDITERRRAEEALRESEQNFRNSLDNSPLGVRIVTANGELLYANRAILDIYGYDSVEEMRTTPRKERYTPESYTEHTERRLRRQSGQPVPANYEISIIRKDGQVRHLAVFRKEVVWGGKMQFQTLYQDITEQKRAQKALAESEKKYRELADLLPQSVFEVDDKGNFLFANRHVFQSRGYGPEDARKGVAVLDLFVREDRARLAENHQRVLRGEKRGPNEYTALRKDGSTFPVMIYSAPIVREGETVGVRGISVDITERKQAEEAHQAIIKTALDGFWLINLEGKFLEVNDSYCQMMGYTREELLKMSIPDVEAAEKPEETAQHIKRIMEQGSDRFETRHKRKDGQIIDVEVSVNYLDVGEGQMFVFIRNITERKKAEERLRQSEEQYRTLVENINDIIFTMDMKGLVTYISPVAERITGYKVDEIIGQSFASFVPSDDLAGMLADFADTLAGESKPHDFRILTKAGDVRHLRVSSRLLLRDGQVVGLTGVITDITERKLAEEKERQLQEELNRSARLVSVGELAAGVAHEINNPLTGILGFSERLLRKSTDEEVIRYTARIHSEAARTAKVVQNLLTFARRQPPKKTYADINEIVLKALELRAYELKSGDITVVTNLTPGLPWVLVDFQQIQQVFLNIIINAEQAINESNVAGRLAIATLDIGSSIQISFSDNGPGIPSEYMGRIFDPFFTTRADRGGTGLGLSISYGILAEHSGCIYARSQPGQGATFFVELPIT